MPKSHRANQPFVAIDCGAISNELAGSTLFGHVRGAFTGAIFDKEGHFESANHGTIFLDEVSNLSYETQAILLRVIQERKFKKLGGLKEIDLDIRIIVASNENLLEAVHNGRFREDLYHRFNEFTIAYTCLTQQGRRYSFVCSSIFLKKAIMNSTKILLVLTQDVMNIFLKYSWPGNLRELRNVVRRAVLLTKSGNISMSSLPYEIVHPMESSY